MAQPVPPLQPNGSTVTLIYTSYVEHIIPVPKSVILDNSSSAKEEVFQFSVGGFMFSGAFWLGAELIYTKGYTEGYKDPFFLGCVAFVLCGSILAITVFNHAKTRQTRLEKCIPEDLIKLLRDGKPLPLAVKEFPQPDDS